MSANVVLYKTKSLKCCIGNPKKFHISNLRGPNFKNFVGENASKSPNPLKNARSCTISRMMNNRPWQLYENDIEYIYICILRTDSQGEKSVAELHDSVAK